MRIYVPLGTTNVESLAHGGPCARTAVSVAEDGGGSCEGYDAGHVRCSFLPSMTTPTKMRKKRRFEHHRSRPRRPSGRAIVEGEEDPVGRDHVVSVFDHLDDYLPPSTLEVHRVRIPSERESPDFSRSTAGDSGEDWVLSPKPCDRTSNEADEIRLERDLKLLPDALEEPGGVSVEGFEELLEMKFGIMALRIRHGLDAWCLGSLMFNPFEALPVVAATSALNRAYFKMWELIHIFALVPAVGDARRFLSAHLCEGPGGFIEAVLDFRARSCDSARAHEDLAVGKGPLENPLLHSFNLENPLLHSFNLENPLPHSSNLENPLPHSSNLENPLPHSSNKSIENIKNPLPHSSNIENPLLHLSNKPVENLFLYSSNGPIENPVLHSSNRFIEKPLLHSSSENLSPARRSQNPENVTGEAFQGSAAKRYDDMWFGLTLAGNPETALTPPVIAKTRLTQKMGGNALGHVHYGADGSGDVTNPANVSAFVEYTLGHSGGEKMDLVTADGAFDVSEDFSSQEHRHLRLVFSEVVAALRLQARGGSFVLKLFDCYTASTLTILCILSRLYRDVEIVRLRTTRVCNSERYVVARGFLGMTPGLEATFQRLNDDWHEAASRGEKVGVLLSSRFSQRFLNAVMRSNAAISAVQIDGIRRALQVADLVGERLPSLDSFGRRKGTISMLRRKLQSHQRLQRDAVALCNELRLPCKSQIFRGAVE